MGKSTLLSALLREWRSRGESVAVLAVDPSSKRSGGALLGDRARIEHDPADRDVFIRSMAAGERLGGLAPATRAAAQALANAFDVVVIETVGVGQSETDVAEAADTVTVVVQPGSGDALQFLKAGIMEVPDVLVVTKADLGAAARRAEEDLRVALRALGARTTPVLAVSSIAPASGIDALADALAAHRAALDIARTACACGGWARSPTSSTSTASAGCARSAAAAPRAARSRRRTRARGARVAGVPRAPDGIDVRTAHRGGRERRFRLRRGANIATDPSLRQDTRSRPRSQTCQTLTVRLVIEPSVRHACDSESGPSPSAEPSVPRQHPPRWPPFRPRRTRRAVTPAYALASRSQSFHSSSRASTPSGEAPKR